MPITLTLTQTFRALGGNQTISNRLDRAVSRQAVAKWAARGKVSKSYREAIRRLCIADNLPVHPALEDGK